MRVLYLLFLFALVLNQAQATHVRGGTISLKHLSGLTYEISVHSWLDMGSSVSFGGGLLTVNGKTVLSLGEDDLFSEEFIEIGQETAYADLTLTHTFEAPGTYAITYQEFNRDAGILNMFNSVDTPFTVKTTMTIDPIYGNNSTPRPAVLPWGMAKLREDYFHSVAFNDQEGDSLSFHRAVALSSDSTLVEGHQFLSGFGDSFAIHPVSGELQWLNPDVSGKFVFAILVREWRKVGDGYVQLSESVFDGMIIVDDRDNNPAATIDIENFNCLGLDQPHTMNIELPEGAVGQVYFSSAYEGTILIDGETLPSTGMGLEVEENTEVDFEFFSDHLSSNRMNFLSIVIQDTSNLIIGSRELHFSSDCSSIVTNLSDSEVRPVRLYPNPANRVMNIDLSHLAGKPVEIQMYNSVGKEVYWDSLIADHDALQFTVAGLPRGIYLVKVAYDKKQHTERIVVD